MCVYIVYKFRGALHVYPTYYHQNRQVFYLECIKKGPKQKCLSDFTTTPFHPSHLQKSRLQGLFMFSLTKRNSLSKERTTVNLIPHFSDSLHATHE